MTLPTDLTAAATLARFADKSLSPLEYWDALERLIAAWEPRIAALYAYDPEGARAEARAATERWARGVPNGPLDGLPITIKEMIATRGVPVPFGTAATPLVPAAEDAPSSARLREAGAIIFAKTTAPDYGMLSSGLSSFHPLTRNPWDLAKNPGGSSSGAGAAAAAGYGPFHVGTDIGGSIRLPAGWCGLVGHKPSFGRVPVDPFYLGRCAGPMTRTVEDTALMMRFIAQPDWRDGMSLPPQTLDWSDLSIDVKGLKLGLMLEAGCGQPVEAPVREVVVAAAKRFEAAGAIIVPVEPILTRAMLDGLDAFWRARSWADISLLPRETQKKVLPYIFEWAARGAEVSGIDAVRGYNQTNEMKKAAIKLFHGVDAVLSPTAPVVSFPAEYASPLNDPTRPFEHIGFTVPWNMAENPAVSINAGFSPEGFPIGLQIIGPRFDDLRVLRLAKAFEEWRGPMTWPKPE